jgi:hypothetical protein
MMPWSDLLRAALVALLAVAAAAILLPAVAGRTRWAWGLLLAPYLTPSLLVGYAYADFSLSLIRHPLLNAAWYSALLALRLAPVAALALYFAPRPLSAGARHCRRLSHGTVDGRFLWQAGCGRAPLAALALVFLLAFGEFEMASLMSVNAWTVSLFDGHAGGLPLLESVRRAAGPFALELAALGLALALLAKQSWAPATAPAARGWPCCAAWALMLAANAAVWGVPAALVLRGTAQGWRVLAENFALGREIATSLALGAASAAAAYALAPRRWRTAVAVCIPGLLGPLVLAVLMGAAMQTTPLLRWRDTPAPLVATLALLLLPPAVLLRHLLRRTAPSSALLAARMTGGHPGRRLLWDLDARRHLWAFFLLFCWGYLELTASAILAPVGMAPVSVRLYNLMHYGRTAVLSAMVVAAFAAPWIVPAVAVATRRLWMRP